MPHATFRLAEDEQNKKKAIEDWIRTLSSHGPIMAWLRSQGGTSKLALWDVESAGGPLDPEGSRSYVGGP